MTLLQRYAASALPQFNRVRYFCQDESRFGLHYIGRTTDYSLWSQTNKDSGNGNLRHFGYMEPLKELVESIFSYSFLMSIPTVISGFKDEFSQVYADTLNILQVDNGLFHKVKYLCVPDNIILLFQPPYSPQRWSDWTFVGASQARLKMGVVRRLKTIAKQSRWTDSSLDTATSCFNYWLWVYSWCFICRKHFLNWY